MPSDPSKDYYYLLRNTPNNETIIVEYGFTDSTGDDVDKIKNNWESLAEAVVKGLASYLKVPYTNKGNNTADSNNVYVVKSGDTLWSIAKLNHLTVDELKKLNNLTSNNLSIGQKLNIKSQTSDKNSSYYIVKPGDNLYSIAEKYNTTVSELKSLNNLTSNLLQIGQTLKINSANAASNVYTVKSGDNLYSLAQKYNTTVANLKSINNLSTDNLSIGQKLVIPSQSIQNKYVVKSGDTLYSIASKYNTTVDQIKRINNLSTNNLSINQVLQLP